MPKLNNPIATPISSQSQDDRYNKKSAEQKLKAAGASPLVLRMYREDV